MSEPAVFEIADGFGYRVQSLLWLAVAWLKKTLWYRQINDRREFAFWWLVSPAAIVAWSGKHFFLPGFWVVCALVLFVFLSSFCEKSSTAWLFFGSLWVILDSMTLKSGLTASWVFFQSVSNDGSFSVIVYIVIYEICNLTVYFTWHLLLICDLPSNTQYCHHLHFL